MDLLIVLLVLLPLLAVLPWYAYVYKLDPEHWEPRDFQALTRTDTPNDFLLAPPGHVPVPVDREAPRFAVPPETLAQAVEALLLSQPRLKVVARSDDGLAWEVVQRSPVMRYPDEIGIRVLPAETGSTIVIYSRSKLGYSDLGVNRKRVEAWLAALSDHHKFA